MSPQKAGSAPRIEFQVHVHRGRRGRRTLEEGPQPEPKAGRESLPRVTRLLALAHRWRDLIDRGEVRDQAEIAELMGITRARVTQIMNLALLAPTIQERILDPGTAGAGPLASGTTYRLLCSETVWADQLDALYSVEVESLRQAST